MRIGLTQQSQRSQEKRQRIYQVAMELFQTNGYSRTTVRDICKAAGITNGTFYHFFREKNGILLEYHQTTMSRIDEMLEPTAQRLSSPFQTVYDYCLAATDLFDQCGRVLLKDILGSRIMSYGYNHDDPLIRQAIDRLDLFLRRAQAAGTIRMELDTRQAAEYVLIAHNGLLQYWMTVDTGGTFRQLVLRFLPRFFYAYTNNA